MGQFSDIFEQAAMISKAYGYDILSKQVQELKEENERLKKIPIAFAEWLSGEGFQQYDCKETWISQEHYGNRVFTTKELFERFTNNIS